MKLLLQNACPYIETATIRSPGLTERGVGFLRATPVRFYVELGGNAPWETVAKIAGAA